MTATATQEEEKVIVTLCDMKNPRVIRYNPVTANHMYFKIRRPPSINGFRGKIEGKPCTLDLIRILYLNQFILCVKNNQEPTIAMIFVQSFTEMNAINSFLLVELQGHVQGRNKPWLVNHSAVGKLTKIHNQTRVENGEIKLFITTSVMLCGIDLPRNDFL